MGWAIFILIIGFFAIVFGSLYASGAFGPTSVDKKAAAKYASSVQRLIQTGFVIENSYPRKSKTPWLLFDYVHNRFAYNRDDYFDVYSLDKVIECSLIQDGTVVHKNAVAPAMVGAAVFGLGGALAGATAMHSDSQVGVLAIRLLLDDMRTPSVMFTILSVSVDKNSPAYLSSFQMAQELYGVFEGVVRINELQRQRNLSQTQSQTQVQGQFQPQAVKENIPMKEQTGIACIHCASILPREAKFCHICGSVVVPLSDKAMDQLRKMEQLRDDGILTAQEFEEKKTILINQ